MERRKGETLSCTANETNRTGEGIVMDMKKYPETNIEWRTSNIHTQLQRLGRCLSLFLLGFLRSKIGQDM